MNWKKIIRRTLAVLALMFVIAVVGGYFYLKSGTFSRLAMRKIIEQANQATGGHTQIGAFDFDLSTLTAHLYGVVVRGTEPAAAHPLLEVNKITVGLKIQSVLRHKINLSEARSTQIEFVGNRPVLDRARTVADIAREHGLRHGVVAADSALRAGVTRSQLEAAVRPMRS